MATTYTVSNVNVGTYPNDGQGESLRSAFTRVNKNFANVYQLALIGGSNTAGSANISIQANGTYLTNAVSILNFVGAGVTANANGRVITITINAGNGGGGANVIYYNNTFSGGNVIYYSNIYANVDLGALNSALANLNYVSLGALNNALANLNYVDLTALNNALANVQPTNLSGLGNALANLTYTDLSRLGNALANVQPVNLNALNNALAQVNVNTLANFTNVFNTIAANAANVAKVGIVSGLTANGTANGQAVYNAADGGLYIWQGNAWVKPAAAFTPTAASIATVEIWNTTPKPTTNLINGRTILYTADSNLYIYVGGAWNSYNSYIQGSGTPTVGANTINAAALQAGIITADKIASGAIIAGKIAAGAINASEIAAGTITSGMIATNSIIAGKIAAGVITASEIATGTITATQIAANTITADQIAAQAVTASEIAANAVYAAAIQAYAITADKIAANAVTAVSVAANSIYGNSIMAYTLTGDRIRANTITGMSIVGNTIYGNAIMAYTLTGDRIMANSVSGIVLIGNTIFGNAIVGNSITGDQIRANSVSGMVLIGNTIFGNAIVGNSITGDQIRANSVSGMVITANTLFANAILTNSITAAQIKANTITAAQIAASSITADRIDTRGLTIKADDGTVLFGSGKLSSAVTFFDGTSDVSVVSALSQNPVVFIGTYATAPSSGIKENNVYKNSTDGNTYVYKSGTWTTFVTGGTGSTGATGATGPAGAAGASGAPGERGYKEFIYGVAGLSSWNDTYAETAITNVGLTKVILDRVTLYNSSSPGSFSQSRFWTGSAWSAIAAYINGGLLVNGTIGADAIATNAVTANKILAGAITADKINVGSLSALSANIGVITTGKIQGDVVFSGNIYGANGTFSGSLTANAINAVDTVNIKNNAISGVVAATKLSTSAPVILAGGGARGILGQSTYNLYSIDMLTTGWTYIPNQTAITGILSLYTDVLDQFQGYDNYIGWLSDPQAVRYNPLRTELQYFRIRAAFGGSNQSGNPQTYWETVPGGAPGQAGQAWGANEITIIDQPFQAISTEVLDVGNASGRGSAALGNTPAYSYRRDKLIVAQTSLGAQAINTPGGPGWYRFVLDMIALPNPAANGKFNDPIIGLVDYSVPSQVWNYAITLVGRSGQTNAYAYPLMYHTIYSGSLTMLLNKK